MTLQNKGVVSSQICLQTQYNPDQTFLQSPIFLPPSHPSPLSLFLSFFLLAKVNKLIPHFIRKWKRLSITKAFLKKKNKVGRREKKSFLKKKNKVERFACVCSVAQSCPTLCGAMHYSQLGFSVHGVFQARILDWVAISYCKGSSQPRDRTCISYVYLHWQVDSLPLAPPGKPQRLAFSTEKDLWGIEKDGLVFSVYSFY